MYNTAKFEGYQDLEDWMKVNGNKIEDVSISVESRYANGPVFYLVYRTK